MDELRARLDRRLGALAAARPDLDRAVRLQHTLLSRQIDMLGVFRTGGIPRVALPPAYLAAKLTRGVPALHGEPIPLPAKILELSAREHCEHLARGGAGDTAGAVGSALQSGALDGAALLSACFGRDERRVRSLAADRSLPPDIAWLAAELALAPFVFLLQCRAMSEAAGALHSWDRGFCPACGSWPAFAEALGGGHRLRCSFCAAAWQLPSYRCVYCGNDAENFATAAPDPEQPGRRLQLCGACGGYLKVLETTEPAEFPFVAIEDLASMDLDIAAIERKYMRPALPEIRRR